MSAADGWRNGGGAVGRSLRIAFLSEFVHPFHKGGAERRYYELASRLVQRGHEVHWFAMQHWPGPCHVVFDGIHLHRALRAVDVYAPAGRRALLPGIQVGVGLALALQRSAVRFDVIDCSQYPFFHIFGARLLRRRTPVIVSWYEFWGSHWHEYLGWRGSVGRRVEWLAACLPERIVAVSEATRSALVEAGISGERVTTVPLGVDTHRADAVSPAPRASDFVFFGRLKNHKNVDLLLRSVALVREELADVTCVLIGDGPERDRLEKLAADLGIAGNVHFAGELPDDEAIALVKAARLFVHPSTKEGGGSTTLLEANACGVPVLAIRHPLGIDPTLIEPGRNGWWVSTSSAEALAAEMSRRLRDHAVLHMMRDSCRSFARDFDWDRIAERCEAVYYDVAPARRQ
jgi:L-malate glycosyltransferase